MQIGRHAFHLLGKWIICLVIGTRKDTVQLCRHLAAIEDRTLGYYNWQAAF